MRNKQSMGIVLLIDDEYIVREIGRDMLNTIGYSCTTASSGKEGIKKFKEMERVDFVLLDVRMPEMSGDQVYYKLKEIKSDIKIIIISGYSKKYIEQEFFKKPVCHFMSKPFKMDILKVKLKENY